MAKDSMEFHSFSMYVMSYFGPWVHVGTLTKWILSTANSDSFVVNILADPFAGDGSTNNSALYFGPC